MRHTSATVALARKLHAEGLDVPTIRRELEARGITASRTTVRAWVDEQYARQRAESLAPAQRRYARVRQRRRVDNLLRELREDGLSYTAISVVLGRYHGVHMSGETVRRRCDAIGLPKDPRKVEIGRRYLQQRAAA